MEVFLVCTNRARVISKHFEYDSRLADPVKTCDAKMHFMIEDAERHLEQVTEEVGPFYGIYKGVIEIIEHVK